MKYSPNFLIAFLVSGMQLCLVRLLIRSSELSLIKAVTSDDGSNNNEIITPRSWRPDPQWIETCVATETAKEALAPSITNQSWTQYRLGDCIKLCKFCTTRTKHLFNGQWRNNNATWPKATATESAMRAPGLHLPAHDTTPFAHVYHARACISRQHVMSGNLGIVEEILGVGTTRGYERPQSNAVVLHLRLGDVVEGSAASVTEMLQNGADAAHTDQFKSSIKSIYEYLDDIEQLIPAENNNHTIRELVLVGGAHTTGYHPKSVLYSSCLRQALETAGYQVSTRFHTGHPDRDFYFATHAQYILLSAGGFSRLMGKMVQRHGGTIVGRKF